MGQPWLHNPQPRKQGVWGWGPGHGSLSIKALFGEKWNILCNQGGSRDFQLGVGIFIWVKIGKLPGWWCSLWRPVGPCFFVPRKIGASTTSLSGQRMLHSCWHLRSSVFSFRCLQWVAAKSTSCLLPKKDTKGWKEGYPQIDKYQGLQRTLKTGGYQGLERALLNKDTRLVRTAALFDSQKLAVAETILVGRSACLKLGEPSTGRWLWLTRPQKKKKTQAISQFINRRVVSPG